MPQYRRWFENDFPDLLPNLAELVRLFPDEQRLRRVLDAVEQSREKRFVRREKLYPVTLTQFGDPAKDPTATLSVNQQLSGFVFSQRPITLPGQTRLDGSIFSLQDITIEHGCRITGNLYTAGDVYWKGGPPSTVRNVFARTVHFLAPPAHISGCVVCDTVRTADQVSLPPGLRVDGGVILRAEGGPITVGNDASYGSFFATADIQTQSHVRMSLVVTKGDFHAGSHNQLGRVEAHNVDIGRWSEVGHIHAGGEVKVAANVLIHSIVAEQDVQFSTGIRIAGEMVCARKGVIRIHASPEWFASVEHLFDLLPAAAGRLEFVSHSQERPVRGAAGAMITNYFDRAFLDLVSALDQRGQKATK